MGEMHDCYICHGKVPELSRFLSPRSQPWEFGRIIRVVQQAVEKFFWACFECGEWVHLECAQANKKKFGVACCNPYCKKGPEAPWWHRHLYRSALALTGLVGFALMAQVTAAAVNLPRQLVWARDRFYFGLPRQLFASWASLLLGFPLGAATLSRLCQEWDFRTRQPNDELQLWGAAFLKDLSELWNPRMEKPEERKKHSHPRDIVRSQWRHEWNLVAGAWVALWGGVIAGQILFGKIVASRNGIPLRNLWVLGQRARLPELIRKQMEMAVTLGNVFGAAAGLIGFTGLWNGLQPTPGDTALERKDRFAEVALTMAGLLVASHLFTLFIKEYYDSSGPHVWPGFGIARLFQGNPTAHSRNLAVVTAVPAAIFAVVPAVAVWVGRD